MYEQQPEHHDPERERQAVPRLYVASLSDYNAGVLHGIWIDAADDPDDIETAITTMLATSPTSPAAEEVAIHDDEGFGPLMVDEYDPIPELCTVARGITEHGPAFAHWAALLGRSDWSRLGDFEDHYRGHWASLADYAEELIDDTGLLPQGGVPDWLAPYVTVDWAGLGEALAQDLLVSAGDDGVYLFDP